MGKAKKGKKGGKDEEVDDELDPGTAVEETSSSKAKDKKGKAKNKDDEEPIEDDDEIIGKKKKPKKDKKKKKDDDLDDLPKEIEELSLTSNEKKAKKEKKQAKRAEKVVAADSSDEEPAAKPGKKKGFDLLDADNSEEDIPLPSKPGKGIPKSGFALLEVEDMDVGSGRDSEPEEKEDFSKPKGTKGGKVQQRTNSVDDSEVVNNERTKEDKAGKKSKKKKKVEDDEEDIERMLAELEEEYEGGKKDVVVGNKTPDVAIKDVVNEVSEVKDGDKVNKDVTVSEEKEVKKAKKKKKGKTDEVAEEGDEKQESVAGDEAEGTVKTAAQKKKEKKEREKQKKLEQKKQEALKKEAEDVKEGETAEKPKEKEESEEVPQASSEAKLADAEDKEDGEEKEGEDDKKKKKKKKGKEDDKKEKKGPGKKTIAAMQEALKKLKDEEDKFKQEEEERIRKLEEAEKLREEQLQLELERKEKKKKKEKERKERLKAEGKLLTAKQKADRARAQAMLEALKAQGVGLPELGEKKPRPGTRIRPNKSKLQNTDATQKGEVRGDETKVEVKIVDKEKVEEPKKEDIKDSWDQDSGDDVKDTWDAVSTEEEEDKSENTKARHPAKKGHQDEDDEDDEDEDESQSEDESDSDSDESSESEEDHRTDAEKRRERALARIQKRREDAEKNKTVDVLRAAVVCVLGHVDTGKTKILDKLRRTNVQDGEAGGITQQIGATNVPIDAIKEQTKHVKGFSEVELRIPGLLIIDTPGHESFSNLRSRGSSLCDIAILVVDIMHGLEPQTIESIGLLKTKKTPFVVALNKIDRLYDWKTFNRRDIQDIIKSQASNTQLEFEQRTKEVILQFAEQGLNAALFYENPDIRSYVSLIPTSAITGEGMGNLLGLIVESSQNMLAKRLMFSEELQATVLEVKAIPGLGTTIDAILVNGTLHEGDTMVIAGTDGPVVTQIRSLLMPQPMKELRVKNAYMEFREIRAAQGVKIAAKDLEKAIAGLNLLVAQKPDEVEICREEVARELRSALSSIKLQERGVYVQASTLGSLEALLEFLRTSKIPYSGIRIGPVVKKDVMKASIMLEHNNQYAVILAFDVKIERDAQELADSLGVRIFQADIIYHLFDKFMSYREELRQKKREEFKHIAVFPCKMKILPQFIFNSRDPIVVGVMVEAGVVKEGTPICVPSREFVDLGIVTSIEINHKNVDAARKGQEVCIKIDPIPGESPKMFGRHFDEKDMLISKISRQSIDACKDYFRDDLVKTDWQLMVELKKMFQIL